MRRVLVALSAVLLSLSVLLSASQPAEARHGRWVGAVAAGIIGGVILHHALRRDRHRYRARYYYDDSYYYGGGYRPYYSSFGYYPRRHHYYAPRRVHRVHFHRGGHHRRWR